MRNYKTFAKRQSTARRYGFKKSGPRSRSRKPYSRNQLYGRPSTNVPIMYNPCPASVHNVIAPRYFTKLRYGFTGYVVSAASSVQFSIYGNSLDNPGATAHPFSTVGTVKPAMVALANLNAVGTTAMAGLWAKYRIHGSTISITSASSTVGGGQGSGVNQLVLLPTVHEEGVTDAQIVMSLPYSKSILTVEGGDMDKNTITRSMDTKTILGVSNINDDTYSSAFGSSPANSWWWSIILNNIGITTFENDQAVVQVIVTYDCEFFDPQNDEIDS